MKQNTSCLAYLLTGSLILVILIIAVSIDVEVAQLIGVVSRCHYTQPITEVVLLEVPLGQVLKVSLGEGNVCKRVEKHLSILEVEYTVFIPHGGSLLDSATGSPRPTEVSGAHPRGVDAPSRSYRSEQQRIGSEAPTAGLMVLRPKALQMTNGHSKRKNNSR